MCKDYHSSLIEFHGDTISLKVFLELFVFVVWWGMMGYEWCEMKWFWDTNKNILKSQSL